MSFPPPLKNSGGFPSGAARAFGMNFSSADDDAPEGPTMRSVGLLQPQTYSLGATTPSFGKAPSLGLSRPSIGLKPLSKPGGLSRSPESFGVQNEWSGRTSPSEWKVKCEDLELVPEDFPLERTHRTILGGDAIEISKRISDALRQMSIEAEFDNPKAKAKCKTNDCVSFRIRLYAGGIDGLPVVVEVQRRSGSASSFMRSCRAILNAAEGKPINSKPSTLIKQLPPIGSMSFMQTVPRQVSDDDGSTEALESVMEMIRSKKRDTNVLALENLKSLTDPVKTNPSVARRVSKCVALGDEKYDLREEIHEITDQDSFGDDFEDEAGLTRHSEHMRHLALGVLSNALSVCANDGSLNNAIDKDGQTWFLEQLIPSLVQELKRAEISACSAYEAAGSIYSLISCSMKAKECFINQSGIGTLESARECGKVRHELLAEEAQRCLDILTV